MKEFEVEISVVITVEAENEQEAEQVAESYFDITTVDNIDILCVNEK